MEYLKNNYLSKTTCRLLRVKLEKGLVDDDKTIKYFNKVKFTNDIREKFYCLINNIKCKPTCKNKKCNNTVRFLNFSEGYRTFCSIKCSKNPEEIKNINLFNGVNKITKGIPNKKKIYQKQVREITRLTYEINKMIINPNNYKLGKMGVDGAYQIDHIVSINYGFENNISPEVIGGLSNLRVVPWRVNAVKNKYNIENEDWDKIIASYNRKDYHQDITIFEFISKFCVDKSGKINSKINYQWFINRRIKERAEEILKLTEYLEKSEKFPFRIFQIYFNLHKYRFEIDTYRCKFMQQIWSPKLRWIELSDSEDENYRRAFMCYDKSIGRYRLKSNAYSMKKTANDIGALNLYYKYFDDLTEKSLN